MRSGSNEMIMFSPNGRFGSLPSSSATSCPSEDGLAGLDEGRRLLAFGRRDQVGRPDLVVRPPAAPVRQLGHPLLELRPRRAGSIGVAEIRLARGRHAPRERAGARAIGAASLVIVWVLLMRGGLAGPRPGRYHESPGPATDAPAPAAGLRAGDAAAPIVVRTGSRKPTDLSIGRYRRYSMSTTQKHSRRDVLKGSLALAGMGMVRGPRAGAAGARAGRDRRAVHGSAGRDQLAPDA